MADINVYCDESNHLESSIRPLVLGAVSCPRDRTEQVNKRIRELKVENGLTPTFEIKWTKVTSKRLPFYIALLNFFFDTDALGVRVLIAKKENINHLAFNQTHDEWYYKMYYQLLTMLISSHNTYRICLDRKDTQGRTKVRKLHTVLSRAAYDFDTRIIREVREVHSHDVNIVQLADLIIGIMQYAAHTTLPDTPRSAAKLALVETFRKRAQLSLTVSTLPSEQKVNLFFWRPQHTV